MISGRCDPIRSTAIKGIFRTLLLEYDFGRAKQSMAHKGRVQQMFFRRRMSSDEVREGAVYRRIHRHNLVEQAEVVWIGTDHFGIPHVRYQVSFIGPDHAESEGVRMLALTSFAERYSPHAAIAHA